MKKKTLSLALALALCLGLTVPAFAADPKAGDTTVTDEAGVTYTFSKPIAGTEQIKFNYTLNEEDLATIAHESASYPDGVVYIDGCMLDVDIANKAAGEVTALLVPMGTTITTSSEYLSTVKENHELVGQYAGMYKTLDLSTEMSDPEYWWETHEIGPETYAIRSKDLQPGAAFFVRNEGGKGGIFIKLVDEQPVTPTEPTTPVTPSVPEEDNYTQGLAYASTQTVTVDGEKMEFQMYALMDGEGNGTNYIKLRDMAQVLNGTQAQFSVGYDNATKTITATTGQAYASTGTEMTTPFSGNRPFTGRNQSILVDGEAVNMFVITLLDDAGGGYNYFKLRDLGSALGFNVGWSKDVGVFIETDKPYQG